MSRRGVFQRRRLVERTRNSRLSNDSRPDFRSVLSERFPSRLTLRSVEIDRRRPDRVILARPSRRRIDLHRNLDSVRAPAIPWTIGGNPLRMCGPGSLLFCNPLLANASLWKSIRENGPGIREGVDPIGSLGGVHLSLDRPIRSPHVRSSPSRRARMTCRRALGESLLTFEPRSPAIRFRDIGRMAHAAASNRPDPRFSFQSKPCSGIPMNDR